MLLQISTLKSYSGESSFLFRGNSAIQFNHKKIESTNSDRYVDKTNEKFGNYCN